jgi:DNA-binding transcriptional regulator YhcF (GntR family)
MTLNDEQKLVVEEMIAFCEEYWTAFIMNAIQRGYDSEDIKMAFEELYDEIY